MSIYIGENRLISKEDVIAILDSNSTLQSSINENFIKGFENNSVIKLTNGQVKTYILTKDKDNIRIYESGISSTSIEKRF